MVPEINRSSKSGALKSYWCIGHWFTDLTKGTRDQQKQSVRCCKTSYWCILLGFPLILVLWSWICHPFSAKAQFVYSREPPQEEGGGPPNAIFFYISCAVSQVGCGDACPIWDKVCKRLCGKQLSEAAPEMGRNGRGSSCQGRLGEEGSRGQEGIAINIGAFFTPRGVGNITKVIVMIITCTHTQQSPFANSHTSHYFAH